MRMLACAIIAMSVVGAGCNRDQEMAKPVADTTAIVPAESESDRINAQLVQLVKANSALIFPNVEVDRDGTLTTLDYQEMIDKVRGQKIGFSAMLADVSRTENGYRADFLPFDLAFDAVFRLDVTEQDARGLVEQSHKSQLTTYVVIARIDALKVHYEKDRRVMGEKGDDPDSMDVEESGEKVGRLILGELIVYEPERTKED